MPDEQDNELADDEKLPDTPLHAHAEGREEDVVGDPAPEVGEEGDLAGDDEEGVGNPVDDAAVAPDDAPADDAAGEDTRDDG